MALPPKTPPRFVPTLTEVVQVPDAVPIPPGPGIPVLSPSQSDTQPKSAAPAVRPGAATHATPATVSVRPVTPSETTPSVALPPQVSLASDFRALPHPPAPLAAPAGQPLLAASPAARALPDGIEEYMVHRVMQRVDVVLDQRLREAIATVVQEQTRSVLPRLREEIESVVRHAVYEAVADELASGAPPVPRG